MKILIAASDLTPLISSDESVLARTVPALPVALQRAGHEVSVLGVLTPALSASTEIKIKGTGVRITTSLGSERLTADVREARSPQGLQMFLCEHEILAGMFSADGAAPAADARAATFFSKLVVELARRLNPAPDVLQVQDWMGALAPVFLRAQNLPFSSVMAIGNPSVHGSFPVEEFGLLNLGWEHFRPTSVEFYGRVNFLKAGIVSSDAVVVDGELERDIVQGTDQGGGLEGVFHENASRLHGISAGLDEHTWNPALDDTIPRKYRSADLSGKAACRDGLLKHLGLTGSPAAPVYLLNLEAGQSVSYLRMLATRLDQLLADDVRLLILGRFPVADPCAVTYGITVRKYLGKLALVSKVDDALLHLALAGADYQLFLGRRRGMSALLLRSLMYGTLPIAPASPGIRQLVDDYQPDSEAGSGLVFYQPDGEALFDVLAHRAPALLTPADRWDSLRQRAMIHAGKFSWARTAVQYAALYEQLKKSR